MNGGEMKEGLLQMAFVLFITASAWQDIRKKSVSVITFQAAAFAGLLLRVWHIWELIQGGSQSLWVLWTALADTGASMLIGVMLWLLSAAAGGAVGMGDGSFFLVSGIYLGFWKNAVLFAGGLLLCFPWCVYMLLKGYRNMRIPFLPFAGLAGLGVIVLG